MHTEKVAGCPWNMGTRFYYAQARIGKFAAEAACGPRGEQGKKLPCPIAQARIGKCLEEAAE